MTAGFFSARFVQPNSDPPKITSLNLTEFVLALCGNESETFNALNYRPHVGCWRSIRGNHRRKVGTGLSGLARRGRFGAAMGPRSHRAAAGRRGVASVPSGRGGASTLLRHAPGPRCPAPPRRIPRPRRAPRTPAAPPPARTPHSCVQPALKRGSDPHKEPRPLSGRLRHIDYIHAFCSTSLTGNEQPPQYVTLQMSLTIKK